MRLQGNFSPNAFDSTSTFCEFSPGEEFLCLWEKAAVESGVVMGEEIPCSSTEACRVMQLTGPRARTLFDSFSIHTEAKFAVLVIGKWVRFGLEDVGVFSFIERGIRFHLFR